MSNNNANPTFALSDIPRRLDELPVRYVRDNAPWKHADVDVTLHHERLVRFPSAVRLLRANTVAPGAVVWRITMLCPGKYGCTPRDIARARASSRKSKSALCAARLRIEVVAVGATRAELSFEARFVEHGEHGNAFCAPPASARSEWRRKLLVTRPLDDAIAKLERDGVTQLASARSCLIQQRNYENRKNKRMRIRIEEQEVEERMQEVEEEEEEQEGQVVQRQEEQAVDEDEEEQIQKVEKDDDDEEKEKEKEKEKEDKQQHQQSEEERNVEIDFQESQSIQEEIQKQKEQSNQEQIQKQKEQSLQEQIQKQQSLNSISFDWNSFGTISNSIFFVG